MREKNEIKFLQCNSQIKFYGNYFNFLLLESWWKKTKKKNKRQSDKLLSQIDKITDKDIDKLAAETDTEHDQTDLGILKSER